MVASDEMPEHSCRAQRWLIIMCAGAAALDKKSKKQFEAKELAKLGARPEKAPRMPASVGKGMQQYPARATAAAADACRYHV
jgi:hypothetical protein